MESLAELLQLVGCELVSGRQEGQLVVWEVRCALRPASCPHCAGMLHSHGWRQRRLWHIPHGLQPCDVALSFQRWKCQACQRVHTPHLPLAEPRARLTNALRQFVGALLVQWRCALEPLRRWLGLGWQTLHNCLPPAPAPLLVTPVEQLRHLCLDEVFFCEPRRYMTVLSTAGGMVLGLAEGRGARPARQLLEALPESIREQVATVASDFNAGQIQAAQSCLPLALVCADCFHLVRLGRRMLRQCSVAQQVRARRAFRELRSVLAEGPVAALGRWLRRWQGQPGPLGTFYTTVDRWQVEIENYLQTGRTTGPAEALNRKIALLRRTACGYTNRNNFIQRILLLNHSPHHQR